MPGSGTRAVATPESHATAAAETVFRAGGNAIDAALAAAAVLTVTYPHNCALGGDLFALVRSPDGRIVSVNASGPAARDVDPSALRARGDAVPVVGAEAVTVPGLVAGWEELHRRGAALGWGDLLATATVLAGQGVAVSPGLARAIAQAPALDHDPGMAATFTAAGRPLRAGDALRQPALAATLGQLSAEGPRAFYEGPIAEALVGTLSRRGSALSEADLREFRPEITAPLAGDFGALEILTSPPNSSGILVLQALAALEASGATDPLGADAGSWPSCFASATRIARACSPTRGRCRSIATRGWARSASPRPPRGRGPSPGALPCPPRRSSRAGHPATRSPSSRSTRRAARCPSSRACSTGSARRSSIR